jgi:hypothetical protein
MGPKVAAIPLLMFLGSSDPAFLTNKLEFEGLGSWLRQKAIVGKLYPVAARGIATGLRC